MNIQDSPPSPTDSARLALYHRTVAKHSAIGVPLAVALIGGLFAVGFIWDGMIGWSAIAAAFIIAAGLVLGIRGKERLWARIQSQPAPEYSTGPGAKAEIRRVFARFWIQLAAIILALVAAGFVIVHFASQLSGHAAAALICSMMLLPVIGLAVASPLIDWAVEKSKAIEESAASA